MDAHRRVKPDNVEVLSIKPSFSCFDYVDEHYSFGNPAIRRLFSLARSAEAITLVVENISPSGMILDENEELLSLYSDHKMSGLDRISFWTQEFSETDLGHIELHEEQCVGYAILKHDTILSYGNNGFNHWVVFEAVFRKYDHKHNCVPCPMEYTVFLAKEEFRIPGVIYAQQNGLNKTCAHVALRSLLSRVLRGDIAYRKISELAEYDPAKPGLSVSQIQKVLDGVGIKYIDYDYEISSDIQFPPGHHRKCLYTGIESGMGAMIIFRLAGRDAPRYIGHMIPFYGHTFNKDTWTPEAELAYFKIGESIRYIPSDNWTSSFLGHDDNFGPNFCVPRLYLPDADVLYAVELLKPGFVYSGTDAEGQSLRFLYSVIDYLDQVSDTTVNNWVSRLVLAVRMPKIQPLVLRAVAVDRDGYVDHIMEQRDWDGNSEFAPVIGSLRVDLPDHLWVVEISIPQLFPANERKLGEIVLDGGIDLPENLEDDYSHFIFVRLPGCYFFPRLDDSEQLNFSRISSGFQSHLEVIKLG